MILPVVKLGTLALKTICKPIANRLKKEAGIHPKFRQFIINIAQTNHRVTTHIQRRIYGHSTDVAIRPLNEEKAVQAAADLIGELFVFSVITTGYSLKSCSSSSSFNVLVNDVMLMYWYRVFHEVISDWVAGAALIFEVQRSARSEARKEEIRKQEIEAMKQREEDLARELELLKQKLNEIEQLAKGRGLSGIFNFRHGHALEESKSARPA
ncbi:OPA3-like protein [Cocos nucifera]|uniref:OPA3-like protein n=1 Tax=Cocos nucifera TaxID=13894 RepID=A0A8K0I426_COCNU|nr:OPA3-like protein [Cocos nucifera]